ncbi:MAG TPA: helix-turn-helix domain-containing protein [Ktedonobacterales bacterium]|jgi:excisionase family DNA binding protein|nr:helix-turn-helix domain-containing protein [Ktedonobacterales bacterium]
MEIEQRWYTTAEIAKLLHVHPRTIQRAILDAELRAIKLSNRAGWRISEHDLQAWLASMANKPPMSG